MAFLLVLTNGGVFPLIFLRGWGMSGDDISIRPASGRCCPDYKCFYLSWDGHTCPDCGADCHKCPHREDELKRRAKYLLNCAMLFVLSGGLFVGGQK